MRLGITLCGVLLAGSAAAGEPVSLDVGPPTTKSGFIEPSTVVGPGGVPPWLPAPGTSSFPPGAVLVPPPQPADALPIREPHPGRPPMDLIHEDRTTSSAPEAPLASHLERLLEIARRNGDAEAVAAITRALGSKGDESTLAAPTAPHNLMYFTGRLGQPLLFRVTGSNNGVVYGTDQYTADSTLATACVHAGLLKPGDTGLIRVTVQAETGSYAGSTRNGITSIAYPSFPFSYRLARVDSSAPGGPASADGEVLENVTSVSQFRDRVGQTLRVRVTGATQGSLWGTNVYTDDSFLPAAAVHAGALKSGETGVVEVVLVPSPPRHEGSSRNGVTSSSWSNFGGSFVVRTASAGATSAAPAGPEILDNLTSLTRYRGRTGLKLLVRVTGGSGGSVWGSGVYTDDSFLPAAAVHAGAVKPGETAVVRVTIRPGLTQYFGTTANGVRSSDYPSYPSSYTVEAVGPDSEVPETRDLRSYMRREMRTTEER